MQHSQTHITLYQEVIFFSWGGKMLRNVESLIMVILSAHIASSITTTYVGLNMLLYISLTDTCNKTFVTNCVST